MTGTAFTRVRGALESQGSTIRDTGKANQFQAQCPAHNDGNPSLTVTGIEGSALVHCHAGCQIADVLAALNLSAADLFDNRRDTTYVYPGGRQVHRRPVKGFHQSGNKTDRTLFRADRITTADHVLVVEGEKDVLAAESVGAVAVCSAMGAGKADRFDWTPLKGKHVTVVADNDKAGREHAAQVVELVTAAEAASVTTVRAAVGKDLADHIAAGQSVGELVEAEPSPAGVRLVSLSDVKAEQVSWLWPGRLPVGKIVTLDGDPGLGKSTLALTIAAAVTTGGDWPDGGRCDHPGDVLLLSAEDGLADTVRPRLDAAKADVTKVHAIEGRTAVDPDTGETYLCPLTLGDVTHIADAMAKTGARLLIVDVLMAFLPSGADSHKDQDIRRVLSGLADAAERNKCTVLLLRHLNKAKGGDPLYRGGGSIGIVGAARAGLLVAKDPADENRRVLAATKSNLGPVPDSLAYRLVDAGQGGVARIEWDGTVTQNAAELLAAPADGDDHSEQTAAENWLKDYLSVEGPAVASKTVKAAAGKERISEATLKRAKLKLGIQDRSEGFPRTTVWELPQSAHTAPGTQNREPTEPTGVDLRKFDEPTGPIFQSAHAVNVEPTGGATVPPGGVTANTPGQTGRVAAALAKAAANMRRAERCPVCGLDGVPEGRAMHFDCERTQQPDDASPVIPDSPADWLAGAVDGEGS